MGLESVDVSSFDKTSTDPKLQILLITKGVNKINISAIHKIDFI